MNLEQIKNDYAVTQGYNNWSDLIEFYLNQQIYEKETNIKMFSNRRLQNHTYAVTILAQKECLKRASENVFKKDVYLGYGEISESRVKEEITNENNIIK